ncbi:hypothetical protein TL16_g12552 [Triparma laevis f. inornata]|uniref:Cytokinin riboside 5'-monophosphate phosphoribohydrolase n=1 Tax=Triparma laevis f. inornata TaxID=1714386 RepID=A0A9W7EX86_9STRA|nr:hypothetical protein TL16_g12552 [Triparma laevis f. inornata]
MDKLGPKPTKAYKSSEFLGSREARQIRVLCEMNETESRLKANGIEGTVLFFGSARSRTRANFDIKLQAMEEAGEDTTRFAKTRFMCEYHEKLILLSSKVARLLEQDRFKTIGILTGGGPGMMEAANEGAFAVNQNKSIGMGISLPFEPSLNLYVTPELAFEYHYFFTRKFWMVYQAMALIVAPGGVGTMDELFEVMTLQQCEKIKNKFPIILFGKQYWQTVVNWDYLVECGTVGQSDVDALFFTDDVDEAFEKIEKGLEEQVAKGLFRHGMLANGSPKKKQKRV